MKKRVLFVCSGNTCRSPMAEYLLKTALRDAGMDGAFTVCSAGTSAYNDSPATEFAIGAMGEIGNDIRGHRSQGVTQKLLNSAAAIFCMDESHRRFLLTNYKRIKRKCFLMKDFLGPDGTDIDDPFLGNSLDYEKIRDKIGAAVGPILKFLSDGNEN